MKDITTEEAVKILKHWEITISACDIPDGNYRFQKSIEKILIELEKKDKIISAMAKFIDTELSSEHLTRVLKKKFYH